MDISNLERRIGALEESTAADRRLLVAAGIAGFGPTPANVDGTPGAGVNQTGEELPWNGQAGAGTPLVFQGTKVYKIRPPVGFRGTREIALSQVAPAFFNADVTITGPGVNKSYPHVSFGNFDDYTPVLEGGQEYELTIVSDGAGHVRLVGINT